MCISEEERAAKLSLAVKKYVDDRVDNDNETPEESLVALKAAKIVEEDANGEIKFCWDHHPSGGGDYYEK